MQFLGFPVSVAWVDERTGIWWVALAHRHWGQKLHRSEDGGSTWQELPTPVYPGWATLGNGKPATLKKIWVIEHAGADRPGELYMGTEPGGLFYSRDHGNSWHLMESLWDHPSRQTDWFGAGRDHPFIHSIVVDPRDSAHFYIAVSCAGVFETRDAGNSWTARKPGIGLPLTCPILRLRLAHDPHMMFACRSAPDILWQQKSLRHLPVRRTELSVGIPLREKTDFPITVLPWPSITTTLCEPG